MVDGRCRENAIIYSYVFIIYTHSHTYQAKAREEEHTKKSVLYVLQLNFYEEKFNGKIQFQTRKVHLFVAYACVVCVYLCACSLLAAADVTAGLCTVCCSVFSLFTVSIAIYTLVCAYYRI